NMKKLLYLAIIQRILGIPEKCIPHIFDKKVHPVVFRKFFTLEKIKFKILAYVLESYVHICHIEAHQFLSRLEQL
ncbi:hypothetical protein BpHYR1_026900, partial [Brachionus plicatilis]